MVRIKHATAKVVTIGLLCMAPAAQAWGPYAHQQIHRLALRLTTNSQFQAWLLKNELSGLRMSMTPDIDWKVFGAVPSDPSAASWQRMANQVEAATHFFDSDIFSRGVGADGRPDFSHLYGVTDYADARAILATTVANNRRFLENSAASRKLVDWNQPLVPQMASLGTGPWRILQLTESAVRSLEAGQQTKALLYLSALGHYLADMAVPEHTSVYFDGNSSKAKGVHLGFEMKMLDWLAGQSGAVKDPQTELYPHFAATEADVKARLETTASFRGKEDILRAVLDLVAEGYPLLEPLSRAFEKAKESSESGDPIWSKFLQSRLALPRGEELTVHKAALKRMADATQIIAATWNYVFEEATRRRNGAPVLDGEVPFDRNRAIFEYAYPHYLNKPVRVTHPNVVPFRRTRAAGSCGSLLSKIGETS